jgi:hypothetical protein
MDEIKKTGFAKLPKIDREAGFLNFIHTNQPNYLEVIAALAGSVQPGLKLDSLTISRRGEVAFRGTGQGAQAATTIRSKMIESGYFANVVIDEQTPVQNNQQMSFRMTAQLRAEPDRKSATKATDNTSATNKPPTGSMPSPEMPAPPPGLIMEGPPPEMMGPPGAVPASGPPAEVRMPAGVTLPPGVSLPPGVTLPPGVIVQPGTAVPTEGAPR